MSLCSPIGSSSGSGVFGCCPKPHPLIVGVVLAIITAVAAYYCLESGFNRLDMAVSSFQRFAAGSLIYMGLVFSAVSVANLVFGCLQASSPSSDEDCEIQVGLSLFAPILFIPAALCFGAEVALKSR